MLADLPGDYLNGVRPGGLSQGELGRLLALMQTMDHNGTEHLLSPLRL